MKTEHEQTKQTLTYTISKGKITKEVRVYNAFGVTAVYSFTTPTNEYVSYINDMRSIDIEVFK